MANRMIDNAFLARGPRGASYEPTLRQSAVVHAPEIHAPT